MGKKIALVQCAASAASTAGVFFGHGPSSKVSTTSPSRRKSWALKCSKPKPGPPVVSISTTRETPNASGLLHELAMAAAIGACCLGCRRRHRKGGFLYENDAKYRDTQDNCDRGRYCCQTHVRPPTLNAAAPYLTSESRFCPSAAFTGRPEAGNCSTAACWPSHSRVSSTVSPSGNSSAS